MPSCSAQKCSNSSKKHFKMCMFPFNDPKRCAIWISNVNRENWTPNKYSALCQVQYFAPEMWENRQDLLKLKRNAVPTLFGDTIAKKDIVETAETPTLATIEEDITILDNRSISPANISDNDKDSEIHSNSIDTSERKELMIEENTSSSCTDNSESLKRQIEKLQKRNVKLEQIYRKTKKKLKNAEYKIKRLNEKVNGNQSNIIKACRKVLNTDQLQLLTRNYKKMPVWSNKTIEKALRFQFTCGRSGYEELLRHMPLPSLRTLRRRLQNLKFNSGILKEIFEFLKLKIACFKDKLDKHCILVLDEMSITPSEIFDTSTNTFMGYATLGNHDNEKNPR
ncbi:PREDICTED: THAP domain-containing protein 1-like [Vollenhovia emeryi]|uniref:THAP domain-containing protein 1-like n=1 Tax=Vollenhovia emeryi TaxID=411798 RepID=UPI0005F45E88|nr:PREDICTED: THAP domain-containing protein 1-like [Vollenhovia emeryi]